MADANNLVIEKVSTKTKFNYSLGSFGSAFLNGFVIGNLQFYYIEKLGAEPTLIASAWLIYAIWNTLNDPIVSYIEDNTRTKIGRRIPYIRYGSFVFGAVFIFCWIPIARPGDTIGLFWNFLAALFLLDTMYTIIGCCYYSLPNEIAVTAKERAGLYVYSSIAGLVNMILGMILPVIFLTGQEGINPLFVPVMIGMAIFCSLLLFGSSFFIKENMFAQLQPHEGFFEGIRETFKNKPFWIFAITLFVGSLISPLFTTGFLYYIDYVVSGQNVVGLIAAFIIGLILSLILTPKFIGKYFPKKSLRITLSLIGICMFILFFIGRNALLAIVPYFFMGLGYIGMGISGSVLNGDVIDHDELITGKRREAIYGGVNAIVTKPGVSIANWFFLLLLKEFGYVKPILDAEGIAIKQPQTPLAITGILFAYCIPLAIGILICVISLHWFPLDGPAWRKKKSGIYELHLQKEKEYLQSLQKSPK